MPEPQRTAFMSLLRESVRLTEVEDEVLSAAGVRNHAGLYTLLQTFPSLADEGLDFPKLSTFAVMGMPAQVRAALAPAPTQPGSGRIPASSAPRRRVAAGAVAPRHSKAAPNSPVQATKRVSRSPIGKRRTWVMKGPWPVRNQGDRGTCVAFAGVACRELAAKRTATNAPDLSEQFLFWAAKTQTSDPSPNGDGTLLRCAAEALRALGICEGMLWPYDGAPMLNNVTHAQAPHTPSSAAKSNALRRKGSGNYRSVAARAAGAAQAVLGHLQSGRPVAVTLALFRDARATHAVTNWESEDAWRYGDIVDPPKGALSHPFGHAVCIIGFVPDVSEEHGGYFVFRNSWGPDWGSDLPMDGYLGPEPGYGQISATYVEKYLWELFAI
jgi:Papain family cysteine protease